MWTVEQRQIYDRTGLRYPSDLTDEEWALVEPFIPPAKRGGRKRTVDVREVLNGILYVLATCCPWRALPKDLPPRSTVHGYLTLWAWDGALGAPAPRTVRPSPRAGGPGGQPDRRDRRQPADLSGGRARAGEGGGRAARNDAGGDPGLGASRHPALRPEQPVGEAVGTAHAGGHRTRRRQGRCRRHAEGPRARSARGDRLCRRLGEGAFGRARRVPRPAGPGSVGVAARAARAAERGPFRPSPLALAIREDSIMDMSRTAGLATGRSWPAWWRPRS